MPPVCRGIAPDSAGCYGFTMRIDDLLRFGSERGQPSFVPVDGGLKYASELVRLVRDVASRKEKPVCVGAACYPEGHVETRDLQKDLRNLIEKVHAGADFLITQLFFDNRCYFDFVGRARAAGIEVPIIPGMMPIQNIEQIQRFTAMCGAHVPAKLAAAMKVRKDDPEGALQLGVAHATLPCADLLRRGAPGIHFYTLNRSPATRAILAALRASEPWLDA